MTIKISHRKVADSPVVKHIFKVRSSLAANPRNFPGFMEESGLSDSIYADILGENAAGGTTFSLDSFGSSDALDYVTPAAQDSAAGGECVLVMVKLNSVAVQSRDLSLPGTVTNASVLSGLNGQPDTILIATTKGILAVVIVSHDSNFEPVIVGHYKSTVIAQYITCHNSGNWFATASLAGQVLVFAKNPLFTPICRLLIGSGTTLGIGFFNSQQHRHVKLFAVLKTDNIVTTTTSFETQFVCWHWYDGMLPASATCWRRPVAISDVDCVVPLVVSEAVLLISKTSSRLVRYDEAHSGAAGTNNTALGLHITCSHVCASGPVAAYLCADSRKVYEVKLQHSGHVIISHVTSVPSVMAAIYGEPVVAAGSSQKLEWVMVSQSGDGICGTANFSDSSEMLISVTDVLWHTVGWNKIHDVVVVDNRPGPRMYSRGELWLCGTNSVTQMRMGFSWRVQEQRSIHKSSKIIAVSYKESILVFTERASGWTAQLWNNFEYVVGMPFGLVAVAKVHDLLVVVTDQFIAIVLTSVGLPELSNLDACEKLESLRSPEKIVEAAVCQSLLVYIVQSTEGFFIRTLDLVSKIRNQSSLLNYGVSCIAIFGTSEVYLAVGSNECSVVIFNIKEMKQVAVIAIDGLHGLLHDIEVITTDSGFIFYVSDMFGSIAALETDKGFSDHTKIGVMFFGGVPIEIHSYNNEIFIISAHLWYLGHKLKPIKLFLDSASGSAPIYDMTATANGVIVLSDKQLYLCKYGSPVVSPCPKKHILGYTPLQSIYLRHLRFLCFLTSKGRLELFDIKSETGLKISERGRKSSSIFENSKIKCFCEWTLFVGGSEYRNVVIGCKNKCIKMIAVRRDKESRSHASMSELRSWSTQGEVSAVCEVPNKNLLIYSAGENVCSRSYNESTKNLDPAVTHHKCESKIISIEHCKGDNIIVTTNSQIKVFKWAGALRLIATSNLIDSSFQSFNANNSIILYSPSSFYVTDINLNKLTTESKGEMPFKFKHGHFDPVWSRLDSKSSAINRFIGYTVDGQITVYNLEYDDDYILSSEKCAVEIENNDIEFCC